MSSFADPPPTKQDWDHDGFHLAAALRIIRALNRGTGCTLTAEMVRAIDFAEGDGEWWEQTKQSLQPKDLPDDRTG